MSIKTTHTENMKTCGASFVDAIQNGNSLKPNCDYSAEFTSTYADTYWHYNVGEQFNLEWIGENAYYIANLF
jgi:hypothetical protein